MCLGLANGYVIPPETMSPEEALEILNNTVLLESRSQGGTRVSKALDVAAEALGKRVAKKVKVEGASPDFMGLWYCPCCNVRLIQHGRKLCGECSQELDWSDVG